VGAFFLLFARLLFGLRHLLRQLMTDVYAAHACLSGHVLGGP
jgi:hypothetical protein